MRGEDARDLWPKVLGLGVFALALWSQPNALVGAFYDDGIYVALAKALAEGHGYRNIHLPGAPAGVHHPFLYPAVLSGLWRLWPSFPGNVALFQLFDAAMLGLAAWLLASSTSRWPLPAGGRYAALILGFAAFPLLSLVGVRFSEPLFIVLVIGAADLADRRSLTRWSVVGAGVLAGLAVLARSIGVAAVAGVTLGLLLRRERRAALVALAVALAVASPWFLWAAAHAGEIDPRIAANYGTYLGEARQAGLDGPFSILQPRALSPLIRLALPGLPDGPWYLLAALFAALVVWGAVRVWSASPALILSLALYGALAGFWHYVPDRFMWIVTPFAALLVAIGAQAAWRRGRLGRIAVVALGVAVAIGYGRRELSSLAGRRFARTAEQASIPLRSLAPAIERGTPRDAVIASEAEAAIFLYTGRRAVPSSLFRWRGGGTEPLPPDTTVRFFCDAGVTHIALFGPEGGVAPVVARLEARGDSTAVPLFTITGGPALYRFRCPR